MPAGKPHIPVPTFTSTELDIANDCALLLWNGISFETGKATVSDETLMSYFAEPVTKHLNSQGSQVKFNLTELHALIITAGLKPMLRKQHEISYPQFEHYLANSIKYLQTDVASAKTEAERWAATSSFVREGGKQLVNINVQTNAGYRVPLSSRILFFATPTQPIANFSNGLAKALNLPLRPEYAIRLFYQAICTGFALNKNKLQAYTMPQSNGILDADIYAQVKASDWWQRRVLDIALLLRLKVAVAASPMPKLQTI